MNRDALLLFYRALSPARRAAGCVEVASLLLSGSLSSRGRSIRAKKASISDKVGGHSERASPGATDGVAAGGFSVGVDKAAAGVVSSGIEGAAAVVRSLGAVPPSLGDISPARGGGAASALPRMIGKPSLPPP